MVVILSGLRDYEIQGPNPLVTQSAYGTHGGHHTSFGITIGTTTPQSSFDSRTFGCETGGDDDDCEGTGTLVDPDTSPGVQNQNPDTCTPVIVDLDGDGIQCGGPQSAVYFDILANGRPVLLHWVLPGSGDAFLVHDRNGNGLADDGGELFGSGTPILLASGRRAGNGFVAMSQYDDPRLGGDGDGFLDSDDAVWRDVWLWLDSNADGYAHAGEMRHASEAGLSHLETVPKESSSRDEHGNRYRYWARAFDAAAAPAPPLDMVDIYLVRLAER